MSDSDRTDGRQPSPSPNDVGTEFTRHLDQCLDGVTDSLQRIRQAWLTAHDAQVTWIEGEARDAEGRAVPKRASKRTKGAAEVPSPSPVLDEMLLAEEADISGAAESIEELRQAWGRKRREP